MKKSALSFAFLVSMIRVCFPQTPHIDFDLNSHTPYSPLTSGSYNLIFEDQFNSLNTTANWEVLDYTDSGYNVIMNPANVTTSGGILNLSISNQTYHNYPRTGGAIASIPWIFPECYVEISCQIPPNDANWAAFWF